MAPKLSALDHLVLSVADLDATVAFYTAILGMEVEHFTPAGAPPRIALRFGQQKINLHNVAAPFRPHASNVQTGSADLCFLSDTPLKAWEDHLSAHHVTIEEGPVTRTGATGPIRSIYLRDPDGNLVEIANMLA